MEKENRSRILSMPVLHENAAGASTVGAIIDTLGFESMTYVITSGTITTGTFSVTIEDSPDDGSGSPTGVWTAVSSDLLTGSANFLVTEDDVSKRVGVISKERHQRLTLVGASTPVAQMACVAILGDAHVLPTVD